MADKKKKKGKLLKHLKYFYSILGYKMIVGWFLQFVVGLLDGIGVALLMPVLSAIGSDEGVSSESMGKLSFVADFLEYIGLELTINSILLFLMAVFLIKSLISYGEAVFKIYLKTYFVKEIRKKGILEFSEFGYKNFVLSDSGRVQNTLSSETGRVVMSYSSYTQLLRNVIFVLVYLTLAFLSNVQFALFIMVAGFLINIFFSKFFKITKKLSKETTRLNNTYQGLLIQFVAFFKYLKSTGNNDIFRKKLESTVDDIIENSRKTGMISSFITISREPLVVVIVVGLILIQVNFFGVALSGLILSLIFFWRAMNYIMMIQQNWNGFLGVSGSFENLELFMKELKEGKEANGDIVVNKFESSLEIKDLGFSYAEESEVLKALNLKVNRNETVAFVGESGSGKTTLVSILSGLMAPDQGAYLIDGINSKEINITTFQKKIGYITQEPVIFADSVFNNVTLWSEKTDENLARFQRALKKASIFDFVQELPKKEDSPMGNNGVMVSGGQKQRISIARELYKNVDILIMDEATSALDSQTEREIQKNIDDLQGEYTILIVAHRLSTVRNADKIVVMDEGVIKDVGKFSDLVVNNEYFKQMVELQKLT